MRSALDFAGAEVSSSSEYVRAVAALRAQLVPGCVGSDSRPQAKPQGGLRASGGCPLVLPPNERLVAVESDKGAHADAASRIPFPKGNLTAGAEGDLRAAVSYAVRHRHSLSEFRRSQMLFVESVGGQRSQSAI